MFALTRSYPPILSSIPGISNPEIINSDQDKFWQDKNQAKPVEQRRPDDSFKRQLEDLKLELQENLVEKSNFAKNFLLPGKNVTEQQNSRLAVRHFLQSESAKVHRLTGPIQFILKLLDCWDLEREDSIKLLGFEDPESEFVFKVLEGDELLRGRDAKDRLSHLFSIRKSLHDFFRDLKAENDWLREPQPLLDGQSPMILLLRGSMEDILLVREYVDSMVGR